MLAGAARWWPGLSGCLMTSHSGIPVHAAKNTAAGGTFIQNHSISGPPRYRGAEP